MAGSLVPSLAADVQTARRAMEAAKARLVEATALGDSAASFQAQAEYAVHKRKYERALQSLAEAEANDTQRPFRAEPVGQYAPNPGEADEEDCGCGGKTRPLRSSPAKDGDCGCKDEEKRAENPPLTGKTYEHGPSGIKYRRTTVQRGEKKRSIRVREKTAKAFLRWYEAQESAWEKAHTKLTGRKAKRRKNPVTFDSYVSNPPLMGKTYERKSDGKRYKQVTVTAGGKRRVLRVPEAMAKRFLEGYNNWIDRWKADDKEIKQAIAESGEKAREVKRERRERSEAILKRAAEKRREGAKRRKAEQEAKRERRRAAAEEKREEPKASVQSHPGEDVTQRLLDDITNVAFHNPARQRIANAKAANPSKLTTTQERVLSKIGPDGLQLQRVSRALIYSVPLIAWPSAEHKALIQLLRAGVLEARLLWHEPATDKVAIKNGFSNDSHYRIYKRASAADEPEKPQPKRMDGTTRIKGGTLTIQTRNGPKTIRVKQIPGVPGLVYSTNKKTTTVRHARSAAYVTDFHHVAFKPDQVVSKVQRAQEIQPVDWTMSADEIRELPQVVIKNWMYALYNGKPLPPEERAKIEKSDTNTKKDDPNVGRSWEGVKHGRGIVTRTVVSFNGHTYFVKDSDDESRLIHVPADKLESEIAWDEKAVAHERRTPEEKKAAADAIGAKVAAEHQNRTSEVMRTVKHAFDTLGSDMTWKKAASLGWVWANPKNWLFEIGVVERGGRGRIRLVPGDATKARLTDKARFVSPQALFTALDNAFPDRHWTKKINDLYAFVQTQGIFRLPPRKDPTPTPEAEEEPIPVPTIAPVTREPDRVAPILASEVEGRLDDIYNAYVNASEARGKDTAAQYEKRANEAREELVARLAASAFELSKQGVPANKIRLMLEPQPPHAKQGEARIIEARRIWRMSRGEQKPAAPPSTPPPPPVAREPEPFALGAPSAHGPVDFRAIAADDVYDEVEALRAELLEAYAAGRGREGQAEVERKFDDLRDRIYYSKPEDGMPIHARDHLLAWFERIPWGTGFSLIYNAMRVPSLAPDKPSAAWLEEEIGEINKVGSISKLSPDGKRQALKKLAERAGVVANALDGDEDVTWGEESKWPDGNEAWSDISGARAAMIQGLNLVHMLAADLAKQSTPRLSATSDLDSLYKTTDAVQDVLDFALYEPDMAEEFEGIPEFIGDALRYLKKAKDAAKAGRFAFLVKAWKEAKIAQGSLEKHFTDGTMPAGVTAEEDKAITSATENMTQAVMDIERLFKPQDRKTEEALWKSAPEHMETAKASLEWFDQRVRARANEDDATPAPSAGASRVRAVIADGEPGQALKYNGKVYGVFPPAGDKRTFQRGLVGADVVERVVLRDMHGVDKDAHWAVYWPSVDEVWLYEPDPAGAFGPKMTEPIYKIRKADLANVQVVPWSAPGTSDEAERNLEYAAKLGWRPPTADEFRTGIGSGKHELVFDHSLWEKHNPGVPVPARREYPFQTDEPKGPQGASSKTPQHTGKVNIKGIGSVPGVAAAYVRPGDRIRLDRHVSKTVESVAGVGKSSVRFVFTDGTDMTKRETSLVAVEKAPPKPAPVSLPPESPPSDPDLGAAKMALEFTKSESARLPRSIAAARKLGAEKLQALVSENETAWRAHMAERSMVEPGGKAWDVWGNAVRVANDNARTLKNYLRVIEEDPRTKPYDYAMLELEQLNDSDAIEYVYSRAQELVPGIRNQDSREVVAEYVFNGITPEFIERMRRENRIIEPKAKREAPTATPVEPHEPPAPAISDLAAALKAALADPNVQAQL